MIVHIAGSNIYVNDHLRQRCAWCGATLLDYALSRVAVPIDQLGPPATWPVGELIAVDGSLSYVVEHKDGDQLPDSACGRLDPEVTK